MQTRLNTLLWLLVAALWVHSPAPASATPADSLAEARDAFQRGEYEKAVPLLSYLLYPNARLARENDLVEAHVLLGIAHFELGQLNEATRELDEALFLDPTLTLDPLLFSEGAIALFEKRKRALAERAERDAQARTLAEERARLRRALENMIVIERRPYYINFVPFGAGQFQNGHNRKGVVFFVAEAVLGGTSAGLWIWQVGKYGFDGVVPDEEADFVRRLQTVQVAAGVACLAVMGIGIIDSLMSYETATRRPADESLLRDLDIDIGAEPEESAAPPSPRKRTSSSLLVIPSATPSGGGVLVRWEF